MKSGRPAATPAGKLEVWAGIFAEVVPARAQTIAQDIAHVSPPVAERRARSIEEWTRIASLNLPLRKHSSVVRTTGL